MHPSEVPLETRAALVNEALRGSTFTTPPTHLNQAMWLAASAHQANAEESHQDHHGALMDAAWEYRRTNLVHPEEEALVAFLAVTRTLREGLRALCKRLPR